jgi:hypothetical protein
MDFFMPSENINAVQEKALNTSIMTAIPRAVLAPSKRYPMFIFIVYFRRQSARIYGAGLGWLCRSGGHGMV